MRRLGSGVCTVPRLLARFSHDVCFGVGSDTGRAFADCAPGTFVVRCSSTPGAFAIDYIDSKRVIKHAQIFNSDNGKPSCLRLCLTEPLCCVRAINEC